MFARSYGWRTSFQSVRELQSAAKRRMRPPNAPTVLVTASSDYGLQCDAGRPSCSQCTDRGVACKGYPTTLNIRFENPGAKLTGAVPGYEAKRPRNAIAIRNRLPEAALAILPQTCNTAALRSQLYGQYIEEYLPHSSGVWPELQTDLEVLPSTSWLHAASSVPASTPLLPDALAALSLAHLAQGAKRAEFLYQSRTAYVRALQGLNKVLQRDGQHLQDDTLAAVMALSIYEVSNFKQPYFVDWADFRSQMQSGSRTRAQGWVSHIRGAQALVQLRGQRNFSNSFSERLFLGSRLTEFISAIGKRKASPAALLWSTAHTQFETPTHIQLFEILHSLPGIMELADNINPSELEKLSQANQGRYTALFDELATNALKLDEQLNVWYAILKAQNQHHHRGELYWRSPSTLYRQLPPKSPVRDLPFEFFHCFPDSDIAQQVVLYWSGRLLLQSTIWLAKERLLRAGYSAAFGTHPSSSTLSLTSGATGLGLEAAHTLPQALPPEALLITQSLEYFVHPDMGFLGTNFVGFPMAVAQGALGHFEAPELAWFDVVFERMRQMKSGLRGFLDEMARGTGDAQLRLLRV
ncbi:uncharacterized protein A1O9_12762 [Exophiala aquamarina CBS 119918]|uniref:Zn(2)-C6 fungal-type domain-containing protein n=1 Tax=Exophiala aquamarina CBS 119918 TaxID=1182545 RepID=A0A072NVU2_9EURO|nr:uncharacterized protein A1O9_12762 [Exophiala aquamarina CBS 119918]KEF51148.1 hypothetical protein A1O9_12762 [Exophiala aquamarina CBS 119918]